MAGLYIHIPFCVKKCRYCDFVSFADRSRMAEYQAALLAEAERAAEEYPARRYDTVFVGGGTPSLLPPEFVSALMRALRRNFEIAPDAEITMECNPGTAGAQTLPAYRGAGVNRLSIGLQSADDGLLARIGRVHSAAQFCETFAHARAAGFGNINVDLMYGLPGQSRAQYLDAVELAAALGAEHVSAYALTLEEGTPLFGAVARGEETLPDEDAVYEMEEAGRALLARHGYARYEISNYARPGFACRHNLNYWRNGEYLGLGLGAHSALRLDGVWTRFCNISELSEYLVRVKAGELPRGGMDRIEKREEMFECVMLGLRTIEGVERAAFRARFGADAAELYPRAVAKLRENGWLRESPDRLALSARGLDFESRASVFFLEEKLTELSS